MKNGVLCSFLNDEILIKLITLQDPHCGRHCLLFLLLWVGHSSRFLLLFVTSKMKVIGSGIQRLLRVQLHTLGSWCKVLNHLYLCTCIEQEDEEANTGSHMKLIVDAFIQQLPNCVNRDLIDKVRIESQLLSTHLTCY